MKNEKRISFTHDHLIDQIIEGRKTATAERIEQQGCLDEWDTGLEVASIYTVYDSKRVPRCRIRITAIRLCSWNDIPQWLWEGETNTTAEEFRIEHLDYFNNPPDDFEFVGIEFEYLVTLTNSLLALPGLRSGC